MTALSTGAGLNTLSNILKEYYMGPVVEQLNKEVLLLSRLESRSEDLVGKRAYVPLSAARTSGIGARAERAPLPEAGAYEYDKAVYDLKYLYGKVQVTGPSMAKTKSEAGAFLQALKSELDGLRNDLQKDLARQVYGDGTGIIADVTLVSGQDLNLADGEAIAKGQVYVGMLIDGYDIGGSLKTAGMIVSAVDEANKKVTINVAATPDPGITTFGRAGVARYAGTGSLSDEIDGLARITSATDTLGEIDPTDPGKEWWAAQSVPATNSGWTSPGASLDDIQKALNKVRIAGGTPSVMVTSLGVQRLFYNALTDLVRYNEPGTLDYASGFKTLSYNGMPLIADIEAPWGKIHILDESTIKVFSDQDWHFLDADGNTLRQSSGYDAFDAYMVRYMNLGATRRNNQVVITGITDADGY